MAGSLGIVAFVVLILFAIFFHEFGHFVTARWAGIKVSKFFIGFGPTLWSVRRGRMETVPGAGSPQVITRPETEYGVKAFPLGGFVKIVGMSPMEDVDPADQPRSFNAAPTWKRAVVLSAGSVTHFITAFVVLLLIFAIVGTPNVNRPTPFIDAVASTVAGKPSPAATAGLKAGDRIVSVNGATVRKWDDVRNTIRSSPGRAIALGIESANGPRRVDITPFPDKEGAHTVGVIGVYPRFSVKRLGPLGALTSSARAEADLVTGFFQKVPQAFSPRTLGLVGGQGPSSNRPFSIIGAGRIAAGLARQGQIAIFLLLFVQINVFVGLFNLMPLPPLDGGHLLVLAIEKIRRRPVDQRALMPVMAVVLSLLALLMVLLIYYDITSPVQLPVR